MVHRNYPRSSTLQFLYDQYIGNNKRRQESFERELRKAEIAQQIYDLRAQAGLTQRQLAKRVGTTASVICRLEDADYQGHTLAMLRRIAAALGQKVQLRFVPAGRRRKRA